MASVCFYFCVFPCPEIYVSLFVCLLLWPQSCRLYKFPFVGECACENLVSALEFRCCREVPQASQKLTFNGSIERIQSSRHVEFCHHLLQTNLHRFANHYLFVISAFFFLLLSFLDDVPLSLSLSI